MTQEEFAILLLSFVGAGVTTALGWWLARQIWRGGWEIVNWLRHHRLVVHVYYNNGDKHIVAALVDRWDKDAFLPTDQAYVAKMCPMTTTGPTGATGPAPPPTQETTEAACNST